MIQVLQQTSRVDKIVPIDGVDLVVETMVLFIVHELITIIHLCASAGDGGYFMVPQNLTHSDMTTTTVRFSINAVNVSGQNYDRDIFCMEQIFR